VKRKTGKYDKDGNPIYEEEGKCKGPKKVKQGTMNKTTLTYICKS